MDQRFEQLWTDYLEGEQDSTGLAELEEMLAGDHSLLERAADLYEEHRLFGLALQPFDREAFVQLSDAAFGFQPCRSGWGIRLDDPLVLRMA